jgi:hypothetical protein
MQTHSSNKPKKFKQTLFARKLMATVFWDRKELLMVEFMQQGTTITSETYWETPKTRCRAIQNKRHGMLTFVVVLLHNDARPHTAASVRALMEHLAGSCLTTLFTALISLRASTTCLPT